MNKFLKLFTYCDSDIERMIAHILDIYESGKCCILCEHVPYCDKKGTVALCGHGVAEYIKRLDTGDEPVKVRKDADSDDYDDCDECRLSGLLEED